MNFVDPESDLDADSRDSPPLLRFEMLAKSFGQGPVFEGISGVIHSGEVILLQGDNGSGKTTLLNVLTGCLEPDSGSITLDINGTTERFTFPRTWSQCLNPWDHFTPERVAECGVSRVWQDIRLSPSLDLADNISVADSETDDSIWSSIFHPRELSIKESTVRQRAIERLASLGLTGRELSSGDRISLGQAKRVAISRALAGKRRLLLLDEPLNGLDQDGICEIVAVLRTLAAEEGLTLLIVEHPLNIPHIVDLVTTVWTLKSGTLSRSSPRQLVKESEDFSERNRNLHRLVSSVVGREVEPITQELRECARLLTFYPENPTFEIEQCPELEVENLVLRLGERRLWSKGAGEQFGLSFKIIPGTVNILEAPNGWGKSSLLDAIFGLVRPENGAVMFRGESVGNSQPWERANQGITVVRSHSTNFESLSINETLELSKAEPVGVTDLTCLGDKLANELSGGESKKLALTATLGGDLVIFDEPFSSLDAGHLDPEWVKKLFQRHSTILILNPTTAI